MFRSAPCVSGEDAVRRAVLRAATTRRLENVAKYFTLHPYKVTIGIRFDIYKQAVTMTAWDWVKLTGAHVDASPALKDVFGDVFDDDA